jgi:aerobic carbon-monoxide dehydrogenase medium subunit
MKPAPFTYHRPETLDEALGLLAEHGDEAKVLAGGQSLVPMLALRLTRFEHLIDLNGLEQLAGVRHDEQSLTLGAMTRHRVLCTDAEVGSAVPLLALATRQVGHFQIRNRGTIGGALAHADPAAEQPAVAMALDAVMEVASPRGTRQVPAADFFQGTWATEVEPDEVLAAVRFERWGRPSGVAVEELARRHGDFAIVGVVCALTLGETDIQRCALGLFGIGPTPVRAYQAEAALVSGSSPEEAARLAFDGVDPPDDLHAPGSYRREVGIVLVRRAIEKARAQVTDQASAA